MDKLDFDFISLVRGAELNDFPIDRIEYISELLYTYPELLLSSIRTEISYIRKNLDMDDINNVAKSPIHITLLDDEFKIEKRNAGDKNYCLIFEYSDKEDENRFNIFLEYDGEVVQILDHKSKYCCQNNLFIYICYFIKGLDNILKRLNDEENLKDKQNRIYRKISRIDADV